MYYIQLFGSKFEGDDKSFDLAATRFESVDDAISGTAALAAQNLFPFDKADGYRVIDGAHQRVHEGLFSNV